MRLERLIEEIDKDMADSVKVLPLCSILPQKIYKKTFDHVAPPYEKYIYFLGGKKQYQIDIYIE